LVRILLCILIYLAPMNRKVALHTLGCKLNFAETTAIENQFLLRDYQVVDFKDKADVYVLNTCTVTENAEKECRQIVRRFLRTNPEAYIIVTGCYAQLRPDEIIQIEGVDAVLGSNEKFKLFSLLNNFEKKQIGCVHVSPVTQSNEFGAAYTAEHNKRTRAFFKIQDGCDYKCTFCTIPLARGKSRSMAPEDVVKEFNELLYHGYKEIILTGVNVGDYGKSHGIKFYDLLCHMLESEGEYRIRISSIEPNLLNQQIIDLTAHNKHLCRHFHIPLQSGSPSTLKRMQRRYKASHYYDLVHRVKERIPDCGIGVDVITGFPGESEEEFIQTYEFIRDLPVSYLHVFTYSERPNTPAIEMENHVDVFERKRRTNMLRILSEKKKHAFYEEMKGTAAEILFESENDNNLMRGFSSNYIRFEHEYISDYVNKFIEVELNEYKDLIYFGKLLNNNILVK
jgi:threonylcarbamoyladenosine tRNA methylthiotransferase MtaB